MDVPRSDRRLLVSRVLFVDGIVLLVVAAIHLLALPHLRQWMAHSLPPSAFRSFSPPFLLNHIVAGILLLPLAVSTLCCASGIREGAGWARVITAANGLALLTLPVILALLMGREYFTAVPFLVAAVLITLVSLSMILPVLWLRSI